MKYLIMDRKLDKVMKENEDEGIKFMYDALKGFTRLDLEKIQEIIQEVLKD